MANDSASRIALNGLWKNNPALVQLLGLCPLLGVSNSVVNALGLGIATMMVVMGSNIVVSLIRHQVTDAIRLPVFVMVIASLTTCIELLMQAYTYELYRILGIFIPLIVTNCIILGRADAYASKNPVLPAAFDGLMMGTGFAAVLVLLGAMRELIGQGTLFSGMDLLFGPMAENWALVVFPNYKQFLFAILPPGAFVFMGLLIAFKNVIDKKLEDARKAKEPQKETGSRRVRVTGNIS
ncbi:electron transporter RnfE [Endozoicomonas montiporae]|uniref:Ion-translocating oxidoreductase complex subunit E n=2 Tax=Endozoicomonas montiporae TaxID=1027273 RepID=A0A081N8G2_9GAMM|nr:electron transport complex subunit E [Endozoicomonas montiporae]AMO55370.1 RnfABCDGE type electron transport complex subunit E1 [Endozoicomonas montiporae CL-33]KEQ14735.1 electron transporter RnfE [Endozoicomonas montiporae]